MPLIYLYYDSNIKELVQVYEMKLFSYTSQEAKIHTTPYNKDSYFRLTWEPVSHFLEVTSLYA